MTKSLPVWSGFAESPGAAGDRDAPDWTRETATVDIGAIDWGDMNGFLAAVVSAAITIGAAGNGTATRETPPAPPKILVVGDSLASSISEELPDELGPAFDVTMRAYGGTAPCDWIGIASKEGWQSDAYDAVVLSFAGNRNTACSFGYSIDDIAIATVLDSEALCAQLTSRRCFFAEQPVQNPVSAFRTGHLWPTQAINQLMRSRGCCQLIVGAGRATRNHRLPDDLHFDPVGEWRFAEAIAAEIRS